MQICGAAILLFFAAGCSENAPEAACTGTIAAAATDKVIVAECARDVAVDKLTECLASKGPDECLASIGTPLCDTDGDGLPDDLESALARAYAPAFAFNGGAFGGNAETHWPANAAFFVKNARLTFGRSRTLVDARPTLDTLGAAITDGHQADNPCPGQGSDFWLCLNDESNTTLVTTEAEMRSLPGGIDVLSVAHPANGPLDTSSHLFVSFSLMFPFNAHSTVDDHEGDWEGVAVFVDRKSGAVDGAWFERHDTLDQQRFVSARTYPVRDPAAEQPYGTVMSVFSALHGLRFWDYSGARRHVVAYVSTGGHAMYDYPANTKIFKYGPRDTHSGDGPKIVPWESRVSASFGATEGDALEVSYVNPGEPRRITLPWARFRGQWGCTDRPIAKSWPGPFGNSRFQRPMFERTWGSPPAAP